MLIDAEKEQVKQTGDGEHEDGGVQQRLEVPDSDKALEEGKTEPQPAAGAKKQGPAPPTNSGHPPAPDGGWGWVVAAAVAFSAVMMILPMMTFPFVFADYLEQLGEGAEGVTTIMSVWSCVASFIGLVCNTLFRRYSFRQIAILGGLLHGLGQGAIALATSLVQFILCSVVIGAGSGLIAPAIFTSINSYFDRRRTFVMGFIQFAIGLGGIGVPVMTQKMLAALGFRNTQLIIGALTLLSIPAAAPLRPLKHEANAENDLKSTEQKCGPQAAEAEMYNICGKTVGMNYVNEETIQEKPAQNGAPNGCINHEEEEKMPAEDMVTQQEEEKQDLLEKTNNFNEQRRRSSVARLSDASRPPRISIASFNSVPYPELGVRVPDDKSKRWWSVIVDVLDLRLLQDLRFSNVLVGSSLSSFVDIAFMTLLPLYLFHNNLSQEESAFCMSLMGVGDLIGRSTLLVIGACCTPSNRMVFLISTTASVAIRAMYIFLSDYTSVMVLSALLGFSKCFILCVFTLVLGDVCSPERFPAAFGLQSVIIGLLNVAFGPLLGKLKDVTGSFSWSIWLLTVLGLLCVIPWTLELAVAQLRKRRKLAHV